MPNTAIMTIPGVTFTNPALPKIEKDAVLTTGVLGLWDALSTDSWPQQAAPTGAAHTWLNLGRSGSALDADVGTDFTWQGAGGFIRPGTAASRISLGAPDLSTGSPSILVTAWVKIPSVPAALTPLVGRAQSTSAATDNQFMLSIGSDGKPRLDIMFLDIDGTTMRVATMSGPNVITTGVHQLGFSVTFSGNTATYALYLDGAQIASASSSGSKLNPSTYSIALGDRRVGNGGGSTTAGYGYYRAHVENLTQSMAAVPGRTASTVVSSGYTNNAARFS